MPVPRAAKSFTKPSRTPCILARALPASSSRTVSASISPASTARCDHPTVAISGAVNTLEETWLEVERGHGVAEEVPHRDPALHRGHAGQHQHAGAVAGGVHPPGGGARDPVDLDEPAVVDGDAGLLQARGPAVFGTEPSASRQCEPVTVRPSVRVHGDLVAVAGSTDSIRERESTFMPRRVSTLLQHLGGVGVLAGQHPVARGDQGDLDTQRHVGAGELGAGHARAHHDHVRGRLGEVVDLLPGQDPLAVGLGRAAGCAARRRWRAGRRRPRAARCRRRRSVDDHGAGAVQPSEARARRATSSRLEPAADVRGLVVRERLDPGVDAGQVDGERVGGVALVVLEAAPRARGPRRARSSARRWRSASCWARSR